jgi:endonuclease YncB( thermonuclease family)
MDPDPLLAARPIGPPPVGLFTVDLLPDRGPHTVYVARVHDGDTLTACLLVPVTIRLATCNAPELGTPEGLRARLAVAGQVLGKVLNADFRGREKYGRVLGDLVLEGEGGPHWLSDYLIANGHAKQWDGRGPRP